MIPRRLVYPVSDEEKRQFDYERRKREEQERQRLFYNKQLQEEQYTQESRATEDRSR